jgi:hypothetical protein
MAHLIRKPRSFDPCALHTLLTALFAAFLPVSLAGQSVPRQLSIVDPLPPVSRAEGPLVLRLPASARHAALANAGLAGNDGDAFLYNPGALSNARGVAMSVQRYGSQATAGALGNVQTIGSLTVGVGVQFLEYRSNAMRYDLALESGGSRLSDGGSLSGSSSAFTLGVARTVKGLRVGANVKYAEDRFGRAHDGTVAFDAGMVKPWGPGTLAFVAQNLGAGLRVPDYERVDGVLPTRVGAGYGIGSYPMGAWWDVGMQAQVLVERDGFVRPAGGVELSYVPVEGVAIVFRNGFRLPREPDEPLVTGGLGVTIDRLSIDWAAEPMRGGRPVSHRLGLRIK